MVEWCISYIVHVSTRWCPLCHSYSLNQSIKTRDALASFEVPDRCLRCDGRPSMVAHRRRSSATRSNGDIDWPVHSLMLSFHDSRRRPLRRLSFTARSPVVWSLAAYHGNRHGRTMITCDDTYRGQVYHWNKRNNDNWNWNQEKNKIGTITPRDY